MYGTLDLIKAQPELARFQFRATNRWIDGAHNRSTIQDFYAAGQEDTSRAEAFTLDAGEPAILLGEDTGPNPAEYLLHALAACLTTTIVYVAAARKVRLTAVESTLTGDMDVRGALGVDPEPRNGFERIRVAFRVAGDAPAEKLREIVERAQGTLGRLRHGHQRRPGRGRRRDRVADVRAHREDGGRRVPGEGRRGARRGPRDAAPPSMTATRPSRTRAIDALKRARYFTAPIPADRGGLGVTSLHDLVVASSRLARGDASVTIGVNMHLIVLLNLVRRWQRRGGRGQSAARRRLRRLDATPSPATAPSIAAAVSELGQDLTRPGRSAIRTPSGLAHRRPQGVLHDVTGGDGALRLRHVRRR